MAQANFIEDIQKLRQTARKHIEDGAVTSNYGLDVKKLIELLKTALATEQVCTLRYKNHHYRAKVLGCKVAADEFMEHANQEQGHVDVLAERIAQLGGLPQLGPEFLLARSHAEYKECDTVGDMIKENLVAERIAIDTYRDMIRFVGDNDPTTRRLLEDILMVEEEHADDLVDLKAEYNVRF